MKRIVPLLLLVIVVLFVVYFATKHNMQPVQVIVTTDTIPPARPIIANLAQAVINVSNVHASSQPMLSNSPSREIFNAITATNLEQWKYAIKDLQYSDTFYGDLESWVMEKQDRNTGVPIIFRENGQTVPYKVRFIDVEASKKSGVIEKVEMHSPIMNIDETRQLGLKLCSLLELDPKDFLAWCDKVGNHWLDAPLYSIGNRSPGKALSYSFGIYMTYDDERPWYINFAIVNP